MKHLLKISRVFNDQVKRGEPAQTVQMCILRSDYMIDIPTQSLKLVEYNSIASSFGCLSNKVHSMHEYVRSKYGKDLYFNYDKPENDYWSYIKADKELKSMHFHSDTHAYSQKIAESFKHAL